VGDGNGTSTRWETRRISALPSQVALDAAARAEAAKAKAAAESRLRADRDERIAQRAAARGGGSCVQDMRPESRGALRAAARAHARAHARAKAAEAKAAAESHFADWDDLRAAMRGGGSGAMSGARHGARVVREMHGGDMHEMRTESMVETCDA
jgi:membrane protein involved in colicin uptake